MQRLFSSFILILFFLGSAAGQAQETSSKALMDAIDRGDQTALEAAIAAGVDPNATDEKGASVLFVATQKKQLPMVLALLEAGANPNARYDAYMGATPLMLAVQGQRIDIARALLDYDADINLADSNGDPAINWAAYYGYTDFARLFLQHGADTKLTGHGNAREIAMRRGHQDFLELLISEKAASVPSPDTAILIEAIEAGDAAGVTDALSYGVSADTLDFTDRPVLGLAARLGRADVVERLLLAGASVDKEDEIGFTPLMEATRDGKLQAAAMLLEAGADANHVSKDTALRLTPMHMAALSGSAEMVQMLAEAGAKIDPLGREKGTPLFWALGEGKVESAMALLDLGADPDIKSSYGYSPADFARQMGNEALLSKMKRAPK